MRTGLAAMLLAAAIIAPALAQDGADPLATVVPEALTALAFTPGVPLLTPESRAALSPLIARAQEPGCYWQARGRSDGEAQALRSALAEFDVAVETVALLVAPKATSAEARLYCAPPPAVTAHFLAGSAGLSDEAAQALSLAVAGYWQSPRTLLVRGYASRDEAPEPLALGLDRAQTAREFLIAQGMKPKLLTIEADTRESGAAARRVVIAPR